MDMQMNRESIAEIPLAHLAKQPFVVGAKQLKKAVKAGRVRCVFLAMNADPAVTDPLELLCTDNHIPITWVSRMEDLGRACGIEVGAAAAAVLNP